MQWTQLLLPIGLLAFMYFLLIRPQQQQAKRRQEMLSALKVGDRIVTVGGLHGTILSLDENKMTLEVASNVKLTFNRSAVGSVQTQ
jgi:preprotein translocase subunit YajC